MSARLGLNRERMGDAVSKLLRRRKDEAIGKYDSMDLRNSLVLRDITSA